MSEFKSYWYVCQACDASIEVVSKGIHFQDPTCNCNNSEVVWCQTSVVESDPNKTKEVKMETNTEVPTTYNANVLVTYKDIIDGVPTYPTIKVNDLEWKLERIKKLEQQLSISNGQISKIIDNLSEESWFNPNTEKEEILNDLCEILDYQPKKEVQFEGTIYFSGRVDVPLGEYEDFDLDDIMSELTVDIYNGDVVIDEFHTEDVREV
jgi:predicted RNA-binding Zn-ribbon protein involved in translation (DUF1610 family)